MREEREERGDENGMEKNKRMGMMSEVTWEVGLHITALINTSEVLLQTYVCKTVWCDPTNHCI